MLLVGVAEFFNGFMDGLDPSLQEVTGMLWVIISAGPHCYSTNKRLHSLAAHTSFSRAEVGGVMGGGNIIMYGEYCNYSCSRQSLI